ncbi:MAG: HAMP domain-containing methyl-accepting chemotaxis protein [Sulfobacillus sp.]|nr:HAMP domain-containing methyl-accepting chemotaxis protein [Sulfobacillus sp.]
MRLTAKVGVLAVVLMGVVIGDGILTVTHANHTLSQIDVLKERDNAIHRAISSMETAFYGYDDQMNMYALTAEMGHQTALAQTTYQQARGFSATLQHNLAYAESKAPNLGMKHLLQQLGTQIHAYNEDAQIVHQDVLHHAVAAAVAMQTVGNTAPSNAIMPLLTEIGQLSQNQVNHDLSAIQQAQTALITWAWITSVIMVIFLFMALGFVQWVAVRPLQRLETIARQLATGVVHHDIKFRSGDEIGQLADAFRHMIRYLTEVSQVAQAIGEGNLRMEPRAAGPDDILGQSMITMHRNLRQMLESIRESSRAIRDRADEFTRLAGQTTDATHQMSQALVQTAEATNESSQGLQNIAGASQQLKASVEQVTGGAHTQAEQASGGEKALQALQEAQQHLKAVVTRMAQSTRQSQQTAENGRTELEALLTAMDRIASVTEATGDAIATLGNHSQQIGHIAQTISTIAEQTNLLALNAAIEAARAGDAGRGFAVVADEVRKLAEQSSRESATVSQLIQTIQETVLRATTAIAKGQDEVKSGQKLADESRVAFRELVTAISEVGNEMSQLERTFVKLESESSQLDTAMRTISRIAQENAHAAKSMAQAASDVTETVSSLAAISEETAAATEELSSTSQHVAEASDDLTQKAQELIDVSRRLATLVERYHLSDHDVSESLREHAA